MSVPVCHQAAWPQEGTQRCIRCLEEFKSGRLFAPGVLVMILEDGEYVGGTCHMRDRSVEFAFGCKVQA